MNSVNIDVDEARETLRKADEQEIRANFKTFTELLIEKNTTITTMESATSGQLASLITDTQGASAIFKGAYITYSNEAKILSGVPEDIISTYGVYSSETAHAMAVAVRKAFGADIGIGITGTMGNVDIANRDSVPGQVYTAIDYRGEVHEYTCELEPYIDRLSYKLAVCELVRQECVKILS